MRSIKTEYLKAMKYVFDVLVSTNTLVNALKNIPFYENDFILWVFNLYYGLNPNSISNNYTLYILYNYYISV